MNFVIYNPKRNLYFRGIMNGFFQWTFDLEEAKMFTLMIYCGSWLVDPPLPNDSAGAFTMDDGVLQFKQIGRRIKNEVL